MKIDNDTIKYIANLAMIELSAEEEQKYSKDLDRKMILERKEE